jgi:hypothetical protein
MVSGEERDEQPKIAAITRGGTRTRADVTKNGKGVKQWIRKAVEPILAFNPQKEKETYHKDRKEILGPDWIASTSNTSPIYDMSSVYHHTIPKVS